MPWQKAFVLARHSKGCHLITDEVNTHIADGLAQTKIGILHLFIQHTSAALTINENFDPDVRKGLYIFSILVRLSIIIPIQLSSTPDMDMAMDRVVPESLNWKHVDEGPDDS
ncbi:hypothetical protein BS47DRAFT_1146686 [Hydnum rufescens UP504]|uniref:Uncharacterized protein n=1 Tax=Hydnum rufescens UP504 TaxID=1448309 RepID=A0A9P6ATZ8_9AGAM|nr:hypothetical protein BS47DRAFT_1146686 [Hydnum rufescens UP504]